MIGSPRSSKRPCQYSSASDEDGHAVHHRAAGLEDLLRVPLRRRLGADREVVDDDIGARLLQDPDDVVRRAGRLGHDLREVLADPVVGHPARDLDPGLRHVGELDRVVRVRPHRLGQVLADLALDDVERGRELDVADVVAAEVHVHQARDELVVGRVLVVLDALEQRVGAVADADDRDAHLVLRARAAVGRAVGGGHWVLSVGHVGDVEPVRQRLQDEVVDGGAAAGGCGLQLAAELCRQAQHGDAARAGDHLAPPAARGERDAEARRQLLDCDVVQVRAATGDLADERALQRRRHPDDDAGAL